MVKTKNTTTKFLCNDCGVDFKKKKLYDAHQCTFAKLLEGFDDMEEIECAPARPGKRKFGVDRSEILCSAVKSYRTEEMTEAATLATALFEDGDWETIG
jgi:hypothetical protein